MQDSHPSHGLPAQVIGFVCYKVTKGLPQVCEALRIENTSVPLAPKERLGVTSHTLGSPKGTAWCWRSHTERNQGARYPKCAKNSGKSLGAFFKCPSVKDQSDFLPLCFAQSIFDPSSSTKATLFQKGILSQKGCFAPKVTWFQSYILPLVPWVPFGDTKRCRRHPWGTPKGAWHPKRLWPKVNFVPQRRGFIDTWVYDVIITGYFAISLQSKYPTWL